MAYPNFLRKTYKLVYENNKISPTVLADFYADFVTHYLNRHVFTRLTNGQNVWYDWNREVDVDVSEKIALNAIFNLTQPTFLLPALTEDKKSNKVTATFLENVLGVTMNIFPLFTKKDWGSLLASEEPVKEKFLTKEAQTLIFNASEVSFASPVLFDGDEVPNFLVGMLKTIQISPVFFNSYETYEDNKFRQDVEKRLDTHEVYGYRSQVASDRATDFVRSTILYSDPFFQKWGKYVERIPWSLKNRFKMNLVPSMKNSYNKIVIASGSAVTATAGVAMVFPTASPFIVGGTVGLTTLVGTCLGADKLMRHVPDDDKGWLVLTSEAKQLLRQIEAWERFKDSSIGVANNYNSYVKEDSLKTSSQLHRENK